VTQRTSVELSSVLAEYLKIVKGTGGQAVQAELNRFVRWCGREKDVAKLTPSEIEGFCTTLEGIGDDRAHRLAILKMFLSHLYRSGLAVADLSRHARIRRSAKTSRSRGIKINSLPVLQLTEEHFLVMQEQLSSLKEARVKVSKEIRHAAADKDVSENSPLDVAREQQGHIEARIREPENTLRRATLLEKIDKKTLRKGKVTLGSRVTIRHKETRSETSYLLVNTNEADPSKGKLSVESPVGKALVSRSLGETVEVSTPSGQTLYEISKLE